MGNLKKDVYRNGSSEGSGSVVGNIKNGVVRKGSSPSLGSGSTIGKTKDYAFKGSSSAGEAEAVALYHFLEKEIF
tara:strand:+ start:110 stop:334 length:225 start_codon:yes stop_codon:yes gene_type:complete